MDVNREIQKYTITVGPGERGERLDVWLCTKIPGVSRSRIQALIKGGFVTLNGRCSVKVHAKVGKAMQVEVVIPAVAPAEVAGENIPLNIIHEDSDIIVVDKPAGLVVHPAAGHPSGTLVNALLYHCSDLAGIGGEMRPGIVHRLDRDTSGAMVVAKNERAMTLLARQFKAGGVGKEYVAVVHGIPDPRSGRIETLIGRSRTDRKKMSVDPASAGRVAITNYEVTKILDGFSIVRINIETGRTHQIRVHMAHMGCPVAGDVQYGGRKTLKRGGGYPARQMLHAGSLSFIHPANNKRVVYKAPLPGDMKKFINQLKRAEKAGAGKES